MTEQRTIRFLWNGNEFACRECCVPPCSKLGRLFRRSGYKSRVSLKSTFQPNTSIVHYIFDRLTMHDHGRAAAHSTVASKSQRAAIVANANDDTGDNDDDSASDSTTDTCTDHVLVLSSMRALTEWLIIVGHLRLHTPALYSSLVLETPELYRYEDGLGGWLQFQWLFDSAATPPIVGSFCTFENFSLLPVCNGQLALPTPNAQINEFTLNGNFAYSVRDGVAVIPFSKSDTHTVTITIANEVTRAASAASSSSSDTDSDKDGACVCTETAQHCFRPLAPHVVGMIRMPLRADAKADDGVVIAMRPVDRAHLKRREFVRAQAATRTRIMFVLGGVYDSADQVSDLSTLLVS